MSKNTQKIIGVFLICLCLPAFIGGITNIVNGYISPAYFIAVMGWKNVQHIVRAAAAQGVFEGLLYGLVFAGVFSCVYIFSNKAALSFYAVFHGLLCIAMVCFGVWILGGVLALLLAVLSPEFYRSTFIGVPDTLSAMLRYAWVGGSIWGLSFGGTLTAIIGTVLFRKYMKNL